ncbi:hypothetical protein Tco_0211710 [Tanacetum coccineum]
MTHPYPNRRFVPQAVLTKSGKINTASASVNTAVRPINTAGSKPSVNHPRPISNAYKKGYSQVTRPGNPQQKEYKEKGVIDSGCSRHMTGNKCYLTEYEDYDGGFFSFGDITLLQILKSVKKMLKRSLLKWIKVELQIKMGRMIKPQEGVCNVFNKKQAVHPNSTNSINTVSTPVSAVGPSFTNDDPSSPVNAAEASNAFEEHLFERFSPFKNAFTLPPVSNVTPMDDTRIFGNAYDDEDVGAEADLNNLETTMNVSPIPTTRIDKDHPKDQIIGDFNSAIQTRRMTKISDEHAMVCYINKQIRTNHKDYQNYLFCLFSLSNETQERDSSSGRSKLDRSNARGASKISTLEGLDTG